MLRVKCIIYRAVVYYARHFIILMEAQYPSTRKSPVSVAAEVDIVLAAQMAFNSVFVSSDTPQELIPIGPVDTAVFSAINAINAEFGKAIG
ncbi:hypothetical protein A3063_26270 [Salmonella enterica subsp. enterica serovar Lille]|nr:hypothetical protein [Salmonella enterica subsp. enterica serovar Lille]EBI4288922.1 hypothetical protein [Salmonella enterica subsp. enterica serovar Lille]EBN0624308.1 hypothetical protein [Salmonella enterica subsp. enterica serovar Lille]ECU6462710.1 hypothetical protein [Salmonella enterica subsp. enterica serovar Lille]